LNILVADDQVDVLEAIRLLLKGAGHRTETADSPRAALAAVKRAAR
jgi:CheY-like chemotaxis protein